MPCRQSHVLNKSSEKSKIRVVRTNAKILYHFPVSSAACLGRISNQTGLTLQERVIRDTQRLEEKSADSETMDKHYWDERKKEYESLEDAKEFAKLIIDNETGPEDKAMKVALGQYLKSNVKTGDLEDWADMCTELSQKNFCVLIKGFWHVSPGLCLANARVACTILRMISRLQLHTFEKKKTFDVMATYFDMALKKLLESYGGVKYGIYT